jgi:hypothetical protein
MDDFIFTMSGKDFLQPLQTSVITGLLLAGCFVGALFAGK